MSKCWYPFILIERINTITDVRAYDDANIASTVAVAGFKIIPGALKKLTTLKFALVLAGHEWRRRSRCSANVFAQNAHKRDYLS